MARNRVVWESFPFTVESSADRDDSEPIMVRVHGGPASEVWVSVEDAKAFVKDLNAAIREANDR